LVDIEAVDGDRQLMSVPVQTGGQIFGAGAPAKVLDAKIYVGSQFRTYDVSPDGQRFLLIKDNAGADQASAAAPPAWSSSSIGQKS
jgi:hypothetical protein